MFVLTLKSKLNKKTLKKLVVSIVLIVCAVLTVVGAVNVYDKPSTKANSSNGEFITAFEEENAQEFVKQFDKAVAQLFKHQTIFIPTEFDNTYIDYNNLQKEQGLNLEKYKGKQCQLYIYKLKGYTIDYADAYISLIVYRDSVIAGHISTGVLNSRLYTFYGE